MITKKAFGCVLGFKGGGGGGGGRAVVDTLGIVSVISAKGDKFW